MTAPDGTRHRVLVVTGDVLTEAMAGTAIRAWHIAHHLASEHEVILATTSGICRRQSETVRLEAPPRDAFDSLEAWCEVLIVQGYVLDHVPVLRSSEKIMVIDLYTPLHLETLALSAAGEAAAREVQNGLILAELNRQLVRGDFFICANERQRALWLGQLSALGRINPRTWDADATLRALVDVVPFGIDDTDPVHSRPGVRGVVEGIGPDDELLVWAGGVYNWLDPLTLVRAVAVLSARRPRLRLYFLGLRHPNPEVPEMAMASATLALAEELDLLGRHVFFNDGWVDYGERQNVLLEADLGVSTHPANAETTFSFRTRILDYLWARLPMVMTEGDGFAELVEQEGLGAVVPAGDAEALAAALERLLADRVVRDSAIANVERVRESYRWATVLAPLVAFCRHPERAADRFPPAPTQERGTVGPWTGHRLVISPSLDKLLRRGATRLPLPARRALRQLGSSLLATGRRRWSRF
jgi:glycosyltransferase involved in cell wall biosynthesis